MAIVEVIKWDVPGSNDILIHKFESEDFNTHSQLVVHEWQEAILFKDGQALDTFGPGRHTLNTKNIPVLGRIVKAFTGGVSPFSCSVYFINARLEQFTMNWGGGDIFIREGGLVLPIGAHGGMSVSITNARKLLEKMMGADADLTQGMIIEKLKGPLQMQIINTLAKEMSELNVSIFFLEQFSVSLASLMMVQVSPVLDEYGLNLEKFSIEGFSRPEDNPSYKRLHKVMEEEALRMREVGVETQEMVARKRAEIDLRAEEAIKLNYSKSQERQFDIMQKLAENEGSGSNIRNDMMGLGMGFGMAGPIGGYFSNLVNTTMNPDSSSPPQPPFSSDAMYNKHEDQGGMPPQLEIVPDSAIPPAAKPVLNSPLPPADGAVMCPGCGHMCRPGAKFCPKCRTELITQSPVTCHNCGAEMDTDDSFCSECGESR